MYVLLAAGNCCGLQSVALRAVNHKCLPCLWETHLLEPGSPKIRLFGTPGMHGVSEGTSRAWFGTPWGACRATAISC